MYWIIERP